MFKFKVRLLQDVLGFLKIFQENFYVVRIHNTVRKLRGNIESCRFYPSVWT